MNLHDFGYGMCLGTLVFFAILCAYSIMGGKRP